MSWEKTTMSVTHGWKSFEKKKKRKTTSRALTTTRMWHLVCFTHTRQRAARITFFFFYVIKSSRVRKETLGSFRIRGNWIDQMQFFCTVNLGRIKKGQRGKKLWISRLNEIVQRDLSAGTVLVIVRAKEKKMREWLQNKAMAILCQMAKTTILPQKKFHFQEEGNFTSEIIRQEPMRGWTGAKIDQAIQIHTTMRKTYKKKKKKE